MSNTEILAAIEARTKPAQYCRSCGWIWHQILTEKRYLRRLAQSAARSATPERLEKVDASKATLAKHFATATNHLATHAEEES